MIFAAIDIGTNAMRLSIVQHECKDFVDTFHKVAYYRVPLRLGADVFESGKLGKNKTTQLTDAIKAFLIFQMSWSLRNLAQKKNKSKKMVNLAKLSMLESLKKKDQNQI